ncbi:MAG: hypothetical protein COA96_17155 [SAR86 cluster bacterium]|uniref:Uncharacterized protein n=1 Tax=SAR86 cluster bacterium TaxID=2030880 RepID=A0A2A5AFK3_9GAMM|nr:MAG: hypothetical protein COA96_17155 [SAR86 cluster bacterium]
MLQVMTSNESQFRPLRLTHEVFSPAELTELCQRIIASGVLGRSKHYSAMLEYLVRCSIADKSPKEIELAIDVLGRGEDFDVSADSAVRVYMHQLRKKLKTYYENHELDVEYQIVIPKGKYTLAASSAQPAPSSVVVSQGLLSRLSLNTGLLVAVVLLLSANLFYMFNQSNDLNEQALQVVSAHPIWGSVLSDDQPILLVMGDYYIFGELNANGNIARMVREFNVNSSSDLEDLQFSDIQRTENYLDLDLSYMPEGSAFALAKIVPILQRSGKSVNITMMSDLTTADIRSNHIVYIGYISALEKLTTMTFAGSGLRIGRSYDELFNVRTAEYYTSDAGLPEEGEPFRDFGMFSTFPASSETQVILISGMRDAGLMHTAQALSNYDALNDLVVAIDSDTDEAVASFEALYEVYGVDRLNFEAELIYADLLDTGKIWGTPQASSLN